MQTAIQNRLRKIQYIEAEIEIQKQILHSIADQDENEIREVVQKIADAKANIHQLLQEIKRFSPQEYQRIQALKNAVATLNAMASEKSFTQIESISTTPKCCITLLSGEKIACLVKASDENGNWVVITTEGELRHLKKHQVAD
ncbi:MAG: hypothetical protein V2I36_01925 [Desulfopila sp.]|jgi:uncharacterized protein YlzI (FlbEa/FlbD family)|nr:hypothetical protein [Desulfopila sp.]